MFNTTRSKILWATLATVAVWAVFETTSTRPALAWSQPVRVRVVPLLLPRTTEGDAPEVDSKASDDAEVVEMFLNLESLDQTSLGSARSWLAEQARRFTAQPVNFAFEIEPKIAPAQPPPAILRPGCGLIDRWMSTKRFTEYFDRLDASLSTAATDEHDSTIFVAFYPAAERARYSSRSVACMKGRRAYVFVPIDERTLNSYVVLFVHELCHTLGATDKYTSNGTVFPAGYADPGREPLYPQSHAEIMALGIPQSPRREAFVSDLQACVIAKVTAKEIGWAVKE